MTESLSQTQLIEGTNAFGKYNGATGLTNDQSSYSGIYNNNNNNNNGNNIGINNHNTNNNNGTLRRHSPTTLTTPANSSSTSPSSSAIYTVVLQPFNSQFPVKTIEINENAKCRIGRQSSAKTVPRPLNGYFDSKVLSRNHALLWLDSTSGGVWVKDTKSSNGTFLNGHRLSAELEESDPFELKTGDEIEFGIDITGEDGSILYHKVACSVSIFNIPVDKMDLTTLKEFNLDNGWTSETDASEQPRSSISSVSTICEPPGKNTITLPSSKPVAKSSKQWELLLATLEAEWHKSQDVEKELLGLKDTIGDLNKTHDENRLKKLSALNAALHNQLDKANQQLDDYAKKTRLQDQAIASAHKQLLALRHSSASNTKSRNAGMDGSNELEWRQQLEQVRLELTEEKRKHSKDVAMEKTRCSEYEQRCTALENRLLDLEQNHQQQSTVKPFISPPKQQNRGSISSSLVDALQIRSVQLLIGVMMTIISSLVYALLVAS